MSKHVVEGGKVKIFEFDIEGNGTLIWKPLYDSPRCFQKADAEKMIKFLENHFKDEYHIHEISNYSVENEFEILNSQNEIVMKITGKNKIDRKTLNQIAIDTRDRFNKYRRGHPLVCD